MNKKSNSAFWLEAIGILVGGFSLFSLTNSIFEFGLSDIFDRLTTFYRLTFHPIVGAIEPPLEWATNRIGLALPSAWQDVVVFYIIIGGAVTRVHAKEKGDRLGLIKMALALGSDLLWVIGAILLPFMLILQNERGVFLRKTFSHYKDVFVQILYALLALAVFLALNAFAT
jgi:hypothetical protein